MRGSAWARVPERTERIGQRLMEAEVALLRAITEQTERWNNTLAMQRVKLQTLSPMRLLERGFTLLYDADGKPITRAGTVRKGDVITLQFADGKVFATVEGKEER